MKWKTGTTKKKKKKKAVERECLFICQLSKGGFTGGIKSSDPNQVVAVPVAAGGGG